MMDFNVDRQVKGYGRRSKRRRAWKRGLAALCCAVAVGTAWGLIRPALTAARDAYCGAEEHTHSVENGCYALVCGLAESDGHTHTEACYETQSVLVCALEEGAAQTVATEKVLTCGMEESAGHTHGDGCYTTVTTLTCGQEESAGHTHTDECYDKEGNLVCGLEESVGHTHSDACYTTETTLTCGQEESAGHTHTDECYTEQTVITEAAAPHVHTDECYETREVPVCGLEESEPHTHTADCYGELICTREEHTHTLECFSNPNADLDTAEQWRAKARAVELTGDYAADLIAVAESQLGYTESTANYVVLDDGETVRGYTLYGAWYGDAYGDWCAMFVSFCLYYAEISDSDVPRAASCPRWVETLDDAGLYVPAGDYSPYEGDIVFFDWDGDGYADHVGLVYERAFADDGYTMTGITTIEGNSGNVVKENKYDADDSRILGYGALPVNPDNIAAVPAASNGIVLAATEGEEGGFSSMITGVSVQYRPNQWSAWKDVTSDTVIEESGQLKFNIAYSIPGGTLSAENHTITYKLPDNITLVTEMTGKVTNASGVEMGDYTMSEDGTLTIIFYDKYATMNAGGDEIDGHIYVLASVSDIQQDENGKIRLPFNDKVDMELTVTEPVRETNDLVVTKDVTNWDSENGKLSYTLTVTSENGTNSAVVLTDTMFNAKYAGNLTVKDKNNNAVTDYTGTPTTGDTSFELSLPALEAGGSYTITYEADFADPGTYTNIDIENDVKVESTDKDGKPISDTGRADVYVDHIVLGKYGILNTNNDTVDWTITVNEGNQDIGGWTLSDTLNGQTLTPDKINVDITLRNETTEVTETITLPYTFPAGTHDKYTITYSTPADKQVGADYVSNTATLTKQDGTKVGDQTGNVWTGSTYNPLTKTADSITDNGDGTATIHWTVKIDAAEGDIPASWTYYDNLWSGQYFTGTQLKALDTVLKEALSKAGLNLSYEIKANKQQNADDIGDTVTWDNIQDGEKYKTYTITFKTTLEKGHSFTFSYETTAPVEGVTSSMYFQNSATINNKVGSSDGVTYRPSVPIISKVDNKNSGGGENTSHEIGDDAVKDGILEWLVKVTMPDNYSGGALTVVETLPEGVDLTYLEILADGVFGARNITTFGEHGLENNQYKVVTAMDGQKITINIPENLANASRLKEFRFVVRVKINDNFTWTDKTEDGVLKEGVFANNVELLDKNNDSLGTDVQTQTITKDENRGVVKKTGSKDENNIIHYSVVINPEGKRLLEGSDYLTVTDALTFSYNPNTTSQDVTLVPDSLVVYRLNADGSKGEKFNTSACPYIYDTEITANWDGWRTEQRTLTIQIPDETPLIIEYRYKIRGAIGSSISVSNTVTIDGVTISDGGNASGDTYEITESGVTAEINGVTICKVDADNNGITLQGAEFNLYIWNETENTYVPMVFDDSTKTYRKAGANESPTSLITNAEGTLEIELTHNTAYRLKEIKAPEKYEIKTEDYDFLIFSADDPYVGPGESVDDFVNGGGHKLSGGSLIYYTNERTTTDISVIKRWVDENGDDVTSTATAGSISFDLYQHEVQPGEAGSGTGEAATLEMQIKIGNEWGGYYWNEIFQDVNVVDGVLVSFSITFYGSPDSRGVPTLYLNGVEMSRSRADTVVSIDQWNTRTDAEYTFTGTLKSGKNYVTGSVDTWSDISNLSHTGPTFEVPQPAETTEPVEDKNLGTYTISATNDWTLTINNLDKKSPSGNPYVYYIDEVSGEQYKVSYLNNSGITYGAITVTNTVSSTSPEVYTLPATGGRGTRGLALLGGTLTAAAGAVLLSRRKRKRKADD